MEPKQEVLVLLIRRAMTRREIERATGMAPNYVESILHNLLSTGQIEYSLGCYHATRKLVGVK